MIFEEKIELIKKLFKKREHLTNKIYFSISSEGYGHSSRMIAISTELERKNYLVGTYGYALDRLKEKGIPCHKVSQELKFVGQDGAFDVAKTIVQNQGWVVKFNKMIDEEVDIIRKSGASCVVADGRMVPVMAAEKLKLPCITITNQSAFYPFFQQDNWLVKLLGVSFDSWMRMYLSSTEEILIPDFEPPYTICLPNLSRNRKIMKRTKFVGPLVNFDYDKVQLIQRESTKPYIVVSLGGHAYRRPLFDCILEVAAKMPDVDFDIFTFFEAEKIPPNVSLKGMISDISSYLKTADLVIAQAGHSTAMEILSLGKLSVIVPDLNQIEQENNAKRMAELQVSEVITHQNLTVHKMFDCIQKVMKDEKYKKNAKFFATMSEGMNAKKRVADILTEYSMRLHRY
ncbi:MAG: UDP-N-acetylglucosamine--N-acetylmuramyl-(pentapeptide) pyrophosphoryl-undecaprenol N-acetylglucosamine transferase [Candidatus Gastranaerophilales bacterium]|nr:UDP-N-acetylglucosamine--N-acetylmuramyl-(pentapeptide) pyrophosphoryl-undecaprenol N-acetylglucosamine transferase [Candidatus Gastranaerophilales bacterium]